MASLDTLILNQSLASLAFSAALPVKQNIWIFTADIIFPNCINFMYYCKVCVFRSVELFFSSDVSIFTLLSREC